MGGAWAVASIRVRAERRGRDEHIDARASAARAASGTGQNVVPGALAYARRHAITSVRPWACAQAAHVQEVEGVGVPPMPLKGDGPLGGARRREVAVHARAAQVVVREALDNEAISYVVRRAVVVNKQREIARAVRATGTGHGGRIGYGEEGPGGMR